MDWIIVVLIIIGIVSRSNKKKKQTQRRQQQAWQDAAAAMDAAEKPKGHIPPKVRTEISSFVKELGSDVLDNGIPTVREAVQEIRGALPTKKPPRPSMPKKAAPQPAAPAAGSLHYQPACYEPMAAQRLTAQRLTTVHPEGETHEEHAAHVERIRAGEQQLQAAQSREEILRSVNLKNLRTAVIMSEVLGKPVSLRPRGQFR